MKLSRRHTSIPFAFLLLTGCIEQELDDGDDDEVDYSTDTAELAYAPGTNGFAWGDFDGNGTADQIWRTPGGSVVVDTNSDRRFDRTLNFPNASAHRFLVPADYDGDGRDDIAIKDSAGVWHIEYAADGFDSTWDEDNPGYGALSLPVPADYDGDGRDDLSVKDSGGVWYINYASNGFASGWDASFGGYGNDSAIPVPADYDGDRRADLSVKDAGGTWYINYASNGFSGGWDVWWSGYGGSTARPAPADYDGDGRADLSVKDSTGTWFINYASNGFPAGWDASHLGHGVYTFPIPADADGDRRADLSVGHGGEYWNIDLAWNGYNGYDIWDRTMKPGTPTATMVDRTTTTLRVRVNGDARTEWMEWGRNDAPPSQWRIVTGNTETFTFTGLLPDTRYCFFVGAVNSEGSARPSPDPCFTTKSTIPETGTNNVWLNLQPVSGPLVYFGTWGPITGARPVRLWLPAVYENLTYRFLRPGYTNADCGNPAATVTMTTANPVDASEIALITGGTPPLGAPVPFTACVVAGAGTPAPTSVVFQLDWEKP